MKLTEKEQQMDEQRLFFHWLIEGRIKFQDLVNAYVYYLEIKDKEKSVLINGLSIPLSQYFTSGTSLKPKTQDIFIRCKTAFNLIKAGTFKGTPLEEELKRLVKKYGYSEDENGVHELKRKA